MLRRGCRVVVLVLVTMASHAWLSSGTAGEAGGKNGRFITYDNGTALDTETQLMWMTRDFHNLEGRAPEDVKEATAWPDKMNRQRYGGYTDWRVPTTEEYQSVYTPEKPRRTYRGDPVGYPSVFADGGGLWYWTRELAPSGRTLEDLYTVHFGTGHLDQKTISDLGEPLVTYDPQASIRLVRFAPSKSHRIAVLKSRDLPPFNLVWAGFSVACRQHTSPYDTYDLRGTTDNAKSIIDSIMTAKYNFVVAIGPLAAQVVKTEVWDIPVIFVMDSNASHQDPPRTHATEVSIHIPIKMQLKTYQALLPAVQTIGVIYDPKKTGVMVSQAKAIGRTLGLLIRAASVASPEEVPAALRRLLGTIDALWLLPDDTVVKLEIFKFMALTTLEHKLPLLGLSDSYVVAGALAALSPDYIDLGRQACLMAKTIARERPKGAMIDVVPPTKINLSINLDVAQKLGLTIPQQIVESAYKVYK